MPRYPHYAPPPRAILCDRVFYGHVVTYAHDLYADAEIRVAASYNYDVMPRFILEHAELAATCCFLD